MQKNKQFIKMQNITDYKKKIKKENEVKIN